MNELEIIVVLIAGGLLIRMFVGKILALLLETTRREVSFLDCAAYEAASENNIDEQIMFEELLLSTRLVDEEQGLSQERYFEWVDEQAGNVISDRVFG